MPAVVEMTRIKAVWASRSSFILLATWQQKELRKDRIEQMVDETNKVDQNCVLFPLSQGFEHFGEQENAEQEEEEVEEQMAIGVRAEPFTYVAHVLGVAAAIMVLVWNIHFRGGLAFESSTNKSLIFNIHPVLMLIGFIIIGGEAIIIYKAVPGRKEVKKIIHLILHFIALIVGIVGIYAAFKFHNESNIANLYSLHSWVGIGTICLYAIQWIYGFLVFFYPGGQPTLRSESLPWHVLFGLFVYILALTSAVLGFLEKLTFLQNSGVEKYGPEAYLVNFNAIVTILFGAFIVLAAVLPRNVEDEFSYSSI